MLEGYESQVGRALTLGASSNEDSSPNPNGASSEELPPGTRVGRYVDCRGDRPGRDGRGLYRPGPLAGSGRWPSGTWKAPASGSASGQVQARLLREAQVMARLSHPNAVAVYDVGMTG